MTTRITMTINGITLSHDYVTGKTAAEYAEVFRVEFSGMLPAYGFTVEAGGVLHVTAPAGAPLSIATRGEPFAPVVKQWVKGASRPDPVIVIIKQAVAQQTYNLSLNGTTFWCKSATVDHPDELYPEYIAEQLRALIASHGFVISRNGAVLTIRESGNTNISFACSDTFNNQLIFAAKGRVPSEADLPARLDTDIVLAVGDVSEGGYYVRYDYREAVKAEEVRTYTTPVPLSPGGLLVAGGVFKPAAQTPVSADSWERKESQGTGAYEETYKPGTLTTFEPAAMPHVLIRQADGTFMFCQADWAKRAVGDELSVPTPSFNGKRIVDLFFFRNRLGIMTEDSLVFSKSGRFFDFWPDTAKQVLDTDPVDVAVSSERVSKLRYAVPFNSNTLLFGEDSQFIVSAQGALTPTTVSVQPTTHFEMSRDCRPLAVGPSVYFVADKDKWASVWEYYVQQGTFSNTAEDVTLQVPRYIPSGVYQLAGATAESMLVGISKADRKSLHVYQYMWKGDQKLQSAWGQWTFTGEVVNAAFIGSQLYLAMRYANEGLFLERIDLQEPLTELMVDRKGHVNWKPYTFEYEFSPVQLRTQNGADFGSLVKLRTATVTYSLLGKLSVGVAYAGRDTAWRAFPDLARAEAWRPAVTGGDLRISVGGSADDTRIILRNDSDKQSVIRSAEFELTNDMRARRV